MGGVLGQAFAFEHRDRLASAMWCDTVLSTPGTPEEWQQRVDAARAADSLAPLADSTIEGFLTETFKERNPGRYKQIRDLIIGTTPAGYLGCIAAIRNFDFAVRLPSVKLPVLVVSGADDTDTPPEFNRRIASLVPGAAFPELRETGCVQSDHAGLASGAARLMSPVQDINLSLSSSSLNRPAVRAHRCPLEILRASLTQPPNASLRHRPKLSPNFPRSKRQAAMIITFSSPPIGASNVRESSRGQRSECRPILAAAQSSRQSRKLLPFMPGSWPC